MDASTHTPTFLPLSWQYFMTSGVNLVDEMLMPSPLAAYTSGSGNSM